MNMAVAAMRKKIGDKGLIDRGLPPEITLGDLDDDALEYLAGGAVYGWYSSRLDHALETEELERLLPEFEEMPIDRGRPIEHWSRQEIVGLLGAVSRLIIKRHLRCSYIVISEYGKTWPVFKEMQETMRAQDAQEDISGSASKSISENTSESASKNVSGIT
jgi:hypothetical protein